MKLWPFQSILVAVAWVCGPVTGSGQRAVELSELAPSAISAMEMTALGRSLLGDGRSEWLHAESAHFVFHAQQDRRIYRAAEEAEFAWQELQRWFGPAPEGDKPNIFLISDADLWRRLIGRYSWPATSLAAHMQGDLFVSRVRRDLAAQLAIPHELVHLRVYRLWGDGAPFWAEEGVAELLGWRLSDAFHRKRYGRGLYRVFPPLSADLIVPWDALTRMESYPDGQDAMQGFIRQIQRMTKSLLEQGGDERLQDFIEVFLQQRLDWPEGAIKGLGLSGQGLKELEAKNRLLLMEEEREGWQPEAPDNAPPPPLRPRSISRP